MFCSVNADKHAHKIKVFPWWLCGFSHDKTRSTNIRGLTGLTFTTPRARAHTTGAMLLHGVIQLVPSR